MSPAAWLAGGLVGAIVFTGLGWRLGIDHMKAKALALKDTTQETRDAAQQGAANAIVKAAADNTKTTTRIKTVTREVPVYLSAQCQHDDRVFDDLTRALQGEPAGPGIVPEGSRDAAGQVVRGDDGQAQ